MSRLWNMYEYRFFFCCAVGGTFSPRKASQIAKISYIYVSFSFVPIPSICAHTFLTSFSFYAINTSRSISLPNSHRKKYEQKKNERKYSFAINYCVCILFFFSVCFRIWNPLRLNVKLCWRVSSIFSCFSFTLHTHTYTKLNHISVLGRNFIYF